MGDGGSRGDRMIPREVEEEEEGEEVKERLAPTCLHLTHQNQPAEVGYPIPCIVLKPFLNKSCMVNMQ